MIINTKFDVGDKVNHKEHGPGTVADICVTVDEDGVGTTYTVHHSKFDNGDADFAGEYCEGELSGVVGQAQHGADIEAYKARSDKEYDALKHLKAANA